MQVLYTLFAPICKYHDLSVWIKKKTPVGSYSKTQNIFSVSIYYVKSLFLSLFKCSKRSKLMCRGQRLCSVLAKKKKKRKNSNDLIVCVFVRSSSFMPQVVLDIFALRLINYRLEKNKLTAEDTSVRFRLLIQTWRILLKWRRTKSFALIEQHMNCCC